jgi:hypothetical protein
MYIEGIPPAFSIDQQPADLIIKFDLESCKILLVVTHKRWAL